MNAAFRTTLIMGLIAGAAAYGAFYYFPWPQETVVDARVNQDLFEDYTTSAVREVAITRFEDDKNNVAQFSLRRKGVQWILPQHQNFVATNNGRIAEAAKSLIGKVVFEKTSDSQQDHVKFGVVDPSEAGPKTNRSSLGTKVVLKDRNNLELASLIIGLKEKGDNPLRHYVRIPGQPSIYTVDINKDIFNTEFAAWIDPNLMQVPTSQSSEVQVAKIKIDGYKLAAEGPKDLNSAKAVPGYRATFSINQEPPKFELEGSDGAGGLKMIDSPSQEQMVSLGKGMQNKEGLVFLTQTLQYRGVIRKPKELAAVFKKPKSDVTADTFKDLLNLGFVFKSVDSKRGLEFDSTNGEVSVSTTDGVTIDMLIGSFGGKSATQNLGLTYNVLMVAKVDPNMLPLPTKPEGVAEDSAENKKYLREVAGRDLKLKSAALRVNELNQSYSNWIYLMPEQLIALLRPDVTIAAEAPVSQPSEPVVEPEDVPADEATDSPVEEAGKK